MKSINLNLLSVIAVVIFSTAVFAQQGATKTVKKNNDSTTMTATITTEKLDADVNSSDDADDDETKEANKIVSKYVNYLEEYRLGPNDIISIEVFNQCPDYCRMNILVPPTAVITYPLIREGIRVAGKTTVEIQDEITKEYDEYIIDPKVMVTLVKAGSARFSVMGKVNMPAIHVMDRRISIADAILEAGGVAKDANKKKVVLARMNDSGYMKQEVINLEDIEKGKAPMVFLEPGDQVFVPGKKFTWDKVFGVVQQASVARILFGSPF
ncbi:MAG: polysaccharide biosynthesis/export family protein [Pyrinomonadaceae bacterium]